ncbi:MAG: energy transducer TonB, partial [Muribaculaceae bacterium]|nr:energy transducer TonB [Muribaculaceae bacterium]
ASAMEGMRAASLETQVRKPAQSDSKVSEIQADANAADVKNGERKAEKMPDRQAEYPGGELEMFKYLMNNIKYPEAAVKAGVEGAVVVSFNVNADGTISDEKVLKSVSPECDAEALRVVRGMVKWKPAISDGKPVSCQFALPINFRLSSGEDVKK